MRAPEASRNRHDADITAFDFLTRRERQVARLVALGHTNAEVGSLLRIHQKTVENHRHSVMAKLRLKTRAELVRLALATGLMHGGPHTCFFQFCSKCKVLWSSSSDFLSDREVHFHGYQSAGPTGPPGAFCFEHGPCGSALLVTPENLIELAGEPLLAASCAQNGTAVECCLAKTASQLCPLKCICAFVWRVSQVVHRWRKN